MLARGTPIYIYVAPFLSAVLFLVWILSREPFILYAALVWTGLVLPPVLFFRDPEREPAEGIVSPADGVVKEAIRKGGRCKVSIFMNVHNVHVNRAPEGGSVLSVTHIPGGFIPAFKKESERNERVVTRLRTPHGTMVITQIAGTVARRIVPYIAPGDRLDKGDRIGMIRFGSRVDVEFDMPPGMVLAVQEGQRVKANLSNIAVGRGDRS